jgi:hypothetical protein
MFMLNSLFESKPDVKRGHLTISTQTTPEFNVTKQAKTDELVWQVDGFRV